MKALMIALMMPEPITTPSRGSNKPAMIAPTMPTTMSPTRPKPTPVTTWPAAQPAIAPTTSQIRIASTVMDVSPPCHRMNSGDPIFASRKDDSAAGGGCQPDLAPIRIIVGPRLGPTEIDMLSCHHDNKGAQGGHAAG